MRLRAVFLLAFVVSLLDATWTRVVADPPPAPDISVIGWIIPVAGADANCPVATHDLRACPSIPPNPYLGFYLVVHGSGKDNNWANVIGNLDLTTCAPYRLIHVRRVAKTDFIPNPCG